MGSFRPPCPLRKSHFSVRTASFFCRAGLEVSHLGSGSIQPKIDASRLESTYLSHFLMDTGIQGYPSIQGTLL